MPAARLATKRLEEEYEMSTGKIVQIIGAVIDVEFPRDAIPNIYDALKIDGTALTLEVQQQLGDGVVRTIALGSSDGLKRGLGAPTPGARLSGRGGKPPRAPIRTGRGEPIDEAGEVKAEHHWAIHRDAPSYED